MTNDSDSDTAVNRRKYLKYMGMCGAAAAAAPAAQENGVFGGAGENKGNGENEEAAEEDEDATNEADIEVDDFSFETEAATVTVEEYEANAGGYISIHDYSRFQFAEGEDPEDYDVPEPIEREFPVCESLIGITDFLPADDHEDVEVPLYTEDAPAVELGAAEEGDVLRGSQPLVAIPHVNNTEEDDFVCPDDPDTPNDPAEFDGAFGEGTFDTETIPVVHDLVVAICEDDTEERQERAARAAELIRDGVLVPQPVDFGGDDEEEDEGDEENGNNGNGNGNGNNGNGTGNTMRFEELPEDVPTGKFEDTVHGQLTVTVEANGEPLARFPVQFNGEQFRTDENGQAVYQLGDGHDNPTTVEVEVDDQTETFEVDHDGNSDVSATFEVGN